MCVSAPLSAVERMKLQNQAALDNLKRTIPLPVEMKSRHQIARTQLLTTHQTQIAELGEKFRLKMLELVSDKEAYTLDKMLALNQSQSAELLELKSLQQRQMKLLVESHNSESDQYKNEQILNGKVSTVPKITATKPEIHQITQQFKDFFAIQSSNSFLTSQQVLVLGDIASALMVLDGESHSFRIKTEKDVPCSDPAQASAFIERNFDSICKMGQQFDNESKSREISQEDKKELEASAFLLKSMPGSLDKNYVQPEPKDLPPLEASKNFLVYKAKNGELALKFTSKAARNTFLETHFKNSQYIPEAHRVGPQFKFNKGGKTPITYSDNPLTIYFPAYKAANGELGVNLVTKENAEILKRLLFPKGKAHAPDGSVLCKWTDRNPGALYFEKIMEKEGNYLRVRDGEATDVCSLHPIALLAMEEHRNRVRSSLAAAATRGRDRGDEFDRDRGDEFDRGRHSAAAAAATRDRDRGDDSEDEPDRDDESHRGGPRRGGGIGRF